MISDLIRLDKLPNSYVASIGLFGITVALSNLFRVWLTVENVPLYKNIFIQYLSSESIFISVIFVICGSYLANHCLRVLIGAKEEPEYILH